MAKTQVVAMVLVGLVLSASFARPATGDLADIGPTPPVRLTDANGKPFDLESLRGKAVLVSFIYTTCNGTCPATTFTLGRVRRALEDAKLWGDRVAFVSITLDPTRDTPEALKRYAGLFDADRPGWHFVTGRPEQVADVLAAWDMWAKVGPGGVLDHPSRIFLVDPKGRQREIYSLEFLRPGTVVDDIRSVLDGEPRRSRR